MDVTSWPSGVLQVWSVLGQSNIPCYMTIRSHGFYEHSQLGAPFLLQHVASFVISREDCRPLGLCHNPVVAAGAVIHLRLVLRFIHHLELNSPAFPREHQQLHALDPTVIAMPVRRAYFTSFSL